MHAYKEVEEAIKTETSPSPDVSILNDNGWALPPATTGTYTPHVPP